MLLKHAMIGIRMALSILAAGALSFGCAGNLEVTRTYTPTQAASMPQGKLVPVAVIRGAQRIPLPATARIEGNRVVLPAGHVHKLAPGDVIEKDDEGRIIGVRTAGNREIHFVPGTAVSPADADDVRGQLTEADASLDLTQSDRIELRGSFAPDAAVPGGGHVESSQSTGLLVAGIVVFALGYLPSVVVGLESNRSDDRVLLVPAAGPWIDLAMRPKCVPPPGSAALPVDPCLEESASRWALVAGGGLQLVGTLLGAFGLPSSTTVVGQDKGVPTATAKPTFSFVPTTNAHGSGAALVGTF